MSSFRRMETPEPKKKKPKQKKSGKGATGTCKEENFRYCSREIGLFYFRFFLSSFTLDSSATSMPTSK